MNSIATTLIIFLSLSVCAVAADKFPSLDEKLITVQERISRQLNDVKGKSAEDVSVEELKTLANQTIETVDPHSEAGQILTEALESQREELQQKERLIESLTKVLNMISFTPLHEADLPKGFPTYTPEGIIEIKEYPAHRKAKDKQFFALFNHIRRNEIAMTTPVELSYDASGNQLKMEAMSFLYGDPETGKTGRDQSVEVVDISAAKVVATGVRGKTNDRRIATALERLQAWLNDNPQWKQVGSPRVMGYNSPFVPDSSSFFEVQIMIEKDPQE